MKTNNLFSFQRFLTLFRQSLIINKKRILISLVAVAGILFILLILFQFMHNFRRWEQGSYNGIFIFFFFLPGVIYTSLSFPAFRSKEKSMAYLMLPSGTSEKFIFELLVRIVAFILIMPLLFWVVANLEGNFIHHFKPDFINYKFSFVQGLNESFSKNPMQGWSKYFAFQASLFPLVASFTGATHFSKSPLVKTLFSFSIIVGGYILFIYLLFKGLNLEHYHPSEDGVLFIKSEDQIIPFISVAGTVINISLLAIAWFRLKEKEV